MDCPEAGFDRQSELIDLQQLQVLWRPRPVVGPEHFADGVYLVIDAGD
jgi:hypothetical protein